MAVRSQQCVAQGSGTRQIEDFEARTSRQAQRDNPWAGLGGLAAAPPATHTIERMFKAEIEEEEGAL